MARTKKRKRTSEVDGLITEEVRRMVGQLVAEVTPLRRVTRSLTQKSLAPVTRSATRGNSSSPAPKKRKVEAKPKKRRRKPKAAKPKVVEEAPEESKEEEEASEESKEEEEASEEEAPEESKEEEEASEEEAPEESVEASEASEEEAEAPEEEEEAPVVEDEPPKEEEEAPVVEDKKGKSVVEDGVDSETSLEVNSDSSEEIVVDDTEEIPSGPGSGSAQHTIIIKHCTNRKYFRARAHELQTGLEEALPDVRVVVNAEKPPGEPIFQVLLAGDTEGPIVSLLNMTKPYDDLKVLDMEEVITTIKRRIQG